MAETTQTNEKAGTPAPPPRLLQVYREQVGPALKEKFGYKNVMEIPRVEKVVVNMGVGEGSRDAREIEQAMKELATITGQKPRLNRSRMSVAQFKIRTGMPVGCSVTLRGRRMWDFLDRLISVALPRVRDFRGLPPNAFDGRGNHSLGIREHNIFVELSYDDISHVRGMNVTTVTNAKTDAEAKELLALLGMPFRK